MVIENYPSGFVSQTIPQTQVDIPKSNVESTNTDSRIGERVVKPNMKPSEVTRIRKDLMKEGLDIDKGSGRVVPRGYYYTNTGKLRQKQSKYDAELVQTSTGPEVLVYRKAPTGVIERRLEKYQAPQTQSSRDIVYDEKGNPVSKAYVLQSDEEKSNTNKVAENLVSTQGGVKDGSVYSGTNVRNTFDSGFNDLGNKSDIQKVEKDFNTVKPSSEVFGTKGTYEKLVELKEQLKYKSIQNPLQRGFYEVQQVGLGIASVPILIATKPVEFVKGIFTSLKNPIESAQSIGESLKYDTSFFIGQQVGGYYTFKGVGKVANIVKDVYVKTGAEYIPPEKVFSSQVLQEGKRFPTVSNTGESIKRFNTPTGEGEIIVSTASPSKLSDTIVGIGKKASQNLEDPGVFVTPKGEGSPAFLGVTPEKSYSFSFNPVKNVKEYFSTPSVTEFKVSSVEKLPRSVVESPGFESVKSFFAKEGGKSGKAFITKRSELGQGELKPQMFRTAEGDFILEFGTTEIEAVVPYSAKFVYVPKSTLGKIKGFEQYTIYEGRAIPIRKANVLAESDIVKEASSKSKVGSVESAYLESSSALNSEKYVTPSSTLKYAYVSSKPLAISSSASVNISSNISSSSLSSPSSSPSYSSSNLSSPRSSIGVSSLPNLSSLRYVPSNVSSPSPSYSTNSIPSISVPSIVLSYIPPKYIPPSVPSKFDKESKKKRLKVLVRKKGKFSVTDIVDDPRKALEIANRRLSQGAQRSAKIVESDSGKPLDFTFIPSQVYKSRKEAGVIIQKSKFSIRSAEEKREIPYAGIKAQRERKSLFGNNKKRRLV